MVEISDKEYLKKRLAEMQLGAHLCCIYRSAEEQLAAVVPFMQFGLERNEKCIYIIDESNKNEVIDAFKRSKVKIEEYIKTKKFEFFTKEDAYLKEGNFDPDRMIELLKQKEKESLKEGFQGLRVTGEMTWVFTKVPGVEKLIEYESKLNYFLPGSRCVAFCQYHETKFKADVLLDVIHTHPEVMIYDRLCFNPYFIPPDEFLARMKGEMSAELSRGIYERTVKDLIKRDNLERERKRAEEELKISEAHLRILINAAGDAIFIIDISNNHFVNCNQYACDNYGYSREELLQLTTADIEVKLTPTEIKAVHNGFKAGTVTEVEGMHRRKDGSVFPVEIHFTAYDPEEPNLVVAVARNITERKRAEEERKESEARLKEAQVLGRIGSWEYDVNSKKIFWSDEAYVLYGRDPALGPPTEEEEAKYYSADQAKILRDYAARSIQSGEEFKYDLEVQLPGGKKAFFSATMIPVKDESGKVVKLLGTVQDITERKRSEEKFKNLAEYSPNMIFINFKGKIVFANKECEDITGYKRDELYTPGFDFLNLVAPENRELVKSNLTKHMRGEAVAPYEFTAITKDGKRIEVLLPTNLIDYEDGKAILGILTDITERKRAEEIIRVSEDKFSKIFNLSPAAIFITTLKEGRFIEINKTGLDMIEYELDEVVGRTVEGLGLWVDPKDRATLIGRLQNEGVVHNMEASLRRKSGKVFSADFSVATIDIGGQHCILTTLIDITERKRAEEAMAGKVKELGKITKIMEGREDRIVELKNEIKKLKGL
jgi:PAS domain S-box-containing protein